MRPTNDEQMNDTAEIIPLSRLAIAFLPVALVIVILARWSLGAGTTLYGMGRMLIQLLLLGYGLKYIFQTESSLIILMVLAAMLCAASWISLRSIKPRHTAILARAFLAILLGGGATLLITTQGVLGLDPWYAPRFMIPLAGMIFSNSMNTLSLAAERFEAERQRGATYETASQTALGAALIPITNSLFAVGLVSIPGMMTGQVLAGISPLIAARYQIMVMCMVFGSSGLTASLFLLLIKPKAAPCETA